MLILRLLFDWFHYESARQEEMCRDLSIQIISRDVSAICSYVSCCHRYLCQRVNEDVLIVEVSAS